MKREELKGKSEKSRLYLSTGEYRQAIEFRSARSKNGCHYYNGGCGFTQAKEN
jgi:hypothetical protein